MIPFLLLFLFARHSPQIPPETLLTALFTNAPTVAASIGPDVENSCKTNVTSKVTNQLHMTISGANRLLLVFVSWVDNANTALTNINCNGTNLTMVTVGTNFFGSDADSNHVYRLINPPTGAVKIWMRWAGTINEIASVGVHVTNANQTTPLGTMVTYSSAAGTVTGATNTVSTAQYDLVLDELMSYRQSNFQMGSGQTRVNESTNVSATVIENRVSKLIASTTSTTVSWTNYDQASELTYKAVPVKAP